MKDKNGIEVCCENCKHYEYCDDKFFPDTGTTADSCAFLPSVAVYDARIAELQKELTVIQESERAEAQEADRLRAEVKELQKKLTETVKLLSERSRECGELEAHNEVLQRRVEEFSMELLDRTMKENKDVLERLKIGKNIWIKICRRNRQMPPTCRKTAKNRQKARKNEPKTATENKARLLHEITEMIKALDNSKLSEDDKQKAKDAITEAAKAIIKNNESEEK